MKRYDYNEISSSGVLKRDIRMTEVQNYSKKQQLGLIWSMILVASPIGIIPWRTLGLEEPFWLPWIHGSILLFLLLTTLFYEPFKPIRRFAAIISILFFMGFGGGWSWGLIGFIRASEAWVVWMAEGPIIATNLSLHLLRLTPAFVILAFLLISGRNRHDFFLETGDIHATVEPSRLLNTKGHESWKKLVAIFTVIFVSVTVIFLMGNYGLDLDVFAANWYLIPVAILIAAINGFNEEFSLRAAPLSEIESTVGKNSALIATSTYFGLGHYYGIPNGIIGVLLSGFLGWFLGKNMLETRGFFMAWFVHFLIDIPIFLFLIMGSV